MKHLISVRPQLKNFLFLFVFLFTLGLVMTAVASSPQAETPPEISNDARCGNCNMKPAMYPKWQTIVVYKTNEPATFDGSKCMFKYSFGPDGKNKTIKAVWVKDFASGKWIDGAKAHYVIGSKTMGPMGKELIPFAEVTNAAEFIKKEGGTIAAYNAISMETLKPLMGGNMKMQGHKQKM